MTESMVQQTEEPVGNPLHVHREGQGNDPVRSEAISDFLDALCRVDVVVEAHARHVREQPVRVEEAEDDRVVLLIRSCEERTRVGDVQMNARVVVRVLRMQLLAEIRDVGVDLDCVDLCDGRAPQRRGNVVTGARADHEDALGVDEAVGQVVEDLPASRDRPVVEPTRRDRALAGASRD